MKRQLLVMSMLMVGAFLLQSSALAQYGSPVTGQVRSQGVPGPAITPSINGGVIVPEVVVPPPPVPPGRIRLGKLTVIPSIELIEEYNDNIFLGSGSGSPNEDEVDDFITHIMPGIALNYDFPERGWVTFGYRGDWALYADNNKNNWDSHRLGLDTYYHAPGGLLFGLSNTFLQTDDPYSDLDQYRLGEQKSRWYDDLRTRLGYQFSRRLRVLAYYNYYVQDYDSAEDFTQDYDANEFGVGAETLVFSKTWAFLRYFYGERDYYTHKLNVTDSNDADLSWHRVTTGLTWDPGGKLSGELNFGYQWRDYDNELDPNGEEYDEEDFFVIATSVNYLMTPRTSFTFNVARAIRESGGGTAESFEDTGVSFSVRHNFFTKFTGIIGAGYAFNDYNTGREDDNYGINAGVEYRIQEWITALASYNYLQKDSNQADQDFDNNRFILGLRAYY